MTSADFRAARLRLGMSHAQFARALGYSDRQSTARMEAGRRKVSKRAELRLARLIQFAKDSGVLTRDGRRKDGHHVIGWRDQLTGGYQLISRPAPGRIREYDFPK